MGSPHRSLGELVAASKEELGNFKLEVPQQIVGI